MGGLLVDDEASRRIEDGLDRVAAIVANGISGFDKATEFHASDMFQGRNGWEDVHIPMRVKACRLAVRTVVGPGARFFFRGVDIAALNARYSHPFAPHQLVFAHVITDIDKAVGELAPPGQVAIVMADEHHAAADSRRNLRDFKLAPLAGYTEQAVKNIGDTVFFGPSHASKLLQAADLATYFLNRFLTVEERDPRSAKVVRKIVSDIRSITAHEYVWRP